MQSYRYRRDRQSPSRVTVRSLASWGDYNPEEVASIEAAQIRHDVLSDLFTDTKLATASIGCFVSGEGKKRNSSETRTAFTIKPNNSLLERKKMLQGAVYSREDKANVFYQAIKYGAITKLEAHVKTESGLRKLNELPQPENLPERLVWWVERDKEKLKHKISEEAKICTAQADEKKQESTQEKETNSENKYRLSLQPKSHDDIICSLVDDMRVKFTVRSTGESEEKDFWEIGLAHQNGQLTQMGEMFKLAAQNYGNLSKDMLQKISLNDYPALHKGRGHKRIWKTLLYRFRNHLKALFGVNDDPFREPEKQFEGEELKDARKQSLQVDSSALTFPLKMQIKTP